MAPAQPADLGGQVARHVALDGRDYVIPEDLFALAEDVLLHRMRLTYEAMARGRTTRQILRELMDKTG